MPSTTCRERRSGQPMAGIARVVTRVKLGERRSDAAYWRAQPPLARLAALEEIRREYHRWKYGAEPRLQRVCTKLVTSCRRAVL